MEDKPEEHFLNVAERKAVKERITLEVHYSVLKGYRLNATENTKNTKENVPMSIC